MSIEFESVDFKTESIKSPSEPKRPSSGKIQFKLHLGIIKTLVEKYRSEIEKFKNGTSKLRSGAMHFDGACPAVNKLAEFEGDPGVDALLQFLKLSRQDFGVATYDAFREWAVNIFDTGETEIEEKVEKPARNYADDISREVYNLFRKMPYPNLDINHIRSTSEKLADIIDDAAVSRCERLQKATLEYCNYLNSRIEALEKNKKTLNSRIKALEKSEKTLNSRINTLEFRHEPLKSGETFSEK
jgi:hypothetical protein